MERVPRAERIAVYEDKQGHVSHAEIRVGYSVSMAGHDRKGGRAMPPGMSVLYVVVDDADAAYARARDAGAEVTEPVDQDYGSREFRITDHDGNSWSLGTYRGSAAQD